MGKRKHHATRQDEIVIPEDEQWRIIDEAGILQGVGRHSEPEPKNDDSDAERRAQPYPPSLNEDNDEEEQGDLSESIFQAVLLVVPMCFLYSMMDLSVCNILIFRDDCAYLTFRLKLMSNAICTTPYLLGGS